MLGSSILPAQPPDCRAAAMLNYPPCHALVAGHIRHAPVDHAALLRQRGGLGGAQQPLAVHKVLELVVALRQGRRGVAAERCQARLNTAHFACPALIIPCALLNTISTNPAPAVQHPWPPTHLWQAAAQRVVAGGRVVHQWQQLGPGVEGAGEQHLAAAQLAAAPGEGGRGLDQPAAGVGEWAAVSSRAGGSTRNSTSEPCTQQPQLAVLEGAACADSRVAHLQG